MSNFGPRPMKTFQMLPDLLQITVACFLSQLGFFGDAQLPFFSPAGGDRPNRKPAKTSKLQFPLCLMKFWKHLLILSKGTRLPPIYATSHHDPAVMTSSTPTLCSPPSTPPTNSTTTQAVWGRGGFKGQLRGLFTPAAVAVCCHLCSSGQWETQGKKKPGWP